MRRNGEEHQEKENGGKPEHIAVGKKHRRGDALRADYVLEYRPGVPVAVVEAKREYAIPGKGLQQAKDYAQLLDLPFAYSTNGKGIVEDDRDTGLENDKLVVFPGPEELWSRYRAWKGMTDDPVADGVVVPFNRALRNADNEVKEPRYYQRTAINRSVAAILGARSDSFLRWRPAPARPSCRCRSSGSSGGADGARAATRGCSTSPIAIS